MSQSGNKVATSDILELVYAEALALPEDLSREAACTPYDHELLRWAADRIRARVAFQLDVENKD